MELLIILVLIVLGVIIPIKIFKPTLVLLAGVFCLPLWSTITLPYVTEISSSTLTYATLDPLLQWALALLLISTAIILYLDQMDAKKKEQENEY